MGIFGFFAKIPLLTPIPYSVIMSVSCPCRKYIPPPSAPAPRRRGQHSEVIMKKVKSIIALVLALTLLPSIFACKANEETFIPTPDTESVETAPIPPEIEEIPPIQEEPNEETPPIETPDIPVATPTPPSEPETPITPEAPVQENARYIRITGDSVNLRSGAGTNYKVLTSSKEGTMYALIEKTGNWYKTYYRNQVAYIST